MASAHAGPGCSYAPIKKRVTAEMGLKRRGAERPPGVPPKIKREDDGMGKALDLSPGLKHTLAQFNLCSRRSLGGPAAFSSLRVVQEGCPSPPQPPMSPSRAPLFLPSDSSTELTQSLLEGEWISCFAVGGEKRLCLPQVLNSVLRDFSLQQINAVCDDLYVYCSRCDARQLHLLKVLGVLPFNAPSCGLITLTDAQRLCNALLRPGRAHPKGAEPDQEAELGFQVEHQCLGKGQGLFVPRLYTRPDAPCVRCLQCRLLFAPETFVMHTHRSPDKRTCHWGFDSSRWPRYLQLGRKHLGTADEPQLKRLLDEIKEKFPCPARTTVDKRGVNRDSRPTHDLCYPGGKLPEAEPIQKQALVFTPPYPEIKEEPGHAAHLHPSYHLYAYDQMVAPNVSLPFPLGKEDELRPDTLAALLKKHYSPVADIHASLSQPGDEVAVAEGTGCGDKAGTPPPEDDKERIVVEMVQMYSKQQEKLKATLQKQEQLEKELQALRGGEDARLQELSAERRELRGELEAAQVEHGARLEEAQRERQRLEQRLEQLKKQRCPCEPDQETRYATQLCELQRRLEHAEAEREELQEALRGEREAREKLEALVTQLRQRAEEKAPPTATPIQA